MKRRSTKPKQPRQRCIIPRADGSPCTLSATAGRLWCGTHHNWLCYTEAGQFFLVVCGESGEKGGT